MTKKVLVSLLVITLAIGIFLLPKASFAEGQNYDEALQAYNTALEQANSELTVLTNKAKQVKEEQKEVFIILKEKKDNEENLDDVKPLVKKLIRIRELVEKKRNIREARFYYAKDLIRQLKETVKEVKEKKDSGASQEELEPFVRKARALKEKIKNILPYSPKVSLNKAGRVTKIAEKLKNNGKEDKAIKLLEGATKRVEREISIMKKQEDNLDKFLELLGQIKGKLEI